MKTIKQGLISFTIGACLFAVSTSCVFAVSQDHQRKSYLDQIEELEGNILQERQETKELHHLAMERFTDREQESKDLILKQFPLDEQSLGDEQLSDAHLTETQTESVIHQGVSGAAYVDSSDKENLFGIDPQKAKEKITIDFDDITLEEALRIIGEGSQMNIVLDPMFRDRRVSLYLKDLSVVEAMELLLQSHDLSFTRTGNALFISSKDKIGSMALINKVIRLKNISADNAQHLVRELARSVTADRVINALVVTGTVVEVAEIERIIAQLDVSRRQVMLVTQILEVSRDDLKELGVDWSSVLAFNFQESKRETELEGVISGAKDAFNFYRIDRTALQFSAALNMLVDNNKAKVLSNPKIVTTAGEEANIFVGDRVPYEVTRVSGGTVTTEVEFAEAGIRLSILPSIIESDYIVVTVKPEVSFIYAWAGENKNYPWIRTREASTNVKVRNLEPFIIGGLISEEDTISTSKVPFLGDMPVLGRLFRFDKTKNDNKEIIITVIPQIMSE